jgi:hypothetical protein
MKLCRILPSKKGLPVQLLFVAHNDFWTAILLLSCVLLCFQLFRSSNRKKNPKSNNNHISNIILAQPLCVCVYVCVCVCVCRHIYGCRNPFLRRITLPRMRTPGFRKKLVSFLRVDCWFFVVQPQIFFLSSKVPVIHIRY